MGQGSSITTREKTLFIIEHGGVHWLPNNPIHGCMGFSKESIYSLVLVTSQHHIESDNMKVKPPLFDPVSHRDHDYDLQAKPSNGQPYFCKHLYSIHAAQKNFRSPAQILECCQYITPTLTSYLAEVFQFQPPRPMYNHCPQAVINDMIRQSH